MQQRTILHMDMNAFFASVEQQADPRLRGKAIAVIGRGRTVVTTASYEARARGVKTGMNTWQARRACPEIIFVIGDNRKYTHISGCIMAMLHDYTPLVQVFSIDEAFLDLTGSLRLLGPAEQMARQIKERIRDRFGLTCSIGIAPNKLLAKVASEMQKPDGLTIIPPRQVTDIMEGLPVGSLCGIGKRTEERLALLGIRSCGQLGRFPESILRNKFGIVGERLRRMGRGEDDEPVVPATDEPPVQSVGHGMTLDHDSSDRQEMLRHLLQLAEMVGRRARRHGIAGRTLQLTVRFADFITHNRQEGLGSHTNDSATIFAAAGRLLDGFILDRPVRLLSISLTNLSHTGWDLPLFLEERRRALATAAMDRVNDRHGEFTVTFGTLAESGEKGARVISPAWRPSGIRQVDVG